MRVRPGLARQRVDQRDGLILGLMRTRGEIARIRARVAGGGMKMFRQFRMNEQRRTGSAQRVQRLFQSARIEMPELRHAGIDEKAFEAAGAGIEHGPKLIGVPGHRTAPQRDIDAALALERMDLRLQRRH